MVSGSISGAGARLRLGLGALITAVLSTACQTVSAAPTVTSAPPTPSATPTFDFPTPQPSRTPTPPATPTTSLPAVEDFGDPIYQSEFLIGSGWDLGSDLFGATSVFDGKLSLVVNQPEALRLAISPAPPLANFYVEVLMRAHVCDGQDEFGLVFRHQPGGNHYRVSLTCQGGLRLRRVLGSFSRALVPFLENSPAVFAGPLAQNKLAVLAVGRDFQIFINDVEVLQARDAELPVGTIGVAVEADDAGQTTVTFESITIYQLGNLTAETPGASATSDG